MSWPFSDQYNFRLSKKEENMKIFSIFILLFTLNAISSVSVQKDVSRSSDQPFQWPKVLLAKFQKWFQKPEDIFQAGKNLIAGYLFEKAFDVINTFCSVALSKEGITPCSAPHITNMSFVLKTNSKDISVPLNRPQRLWPMKEFNRNLSLVIMFTGWTTNINDTENGALDAIYAAYKCRGNVNFVTANTAAYVDKLENWLAFHWDIWLEIIRFQGIIWLVS